MNEKYKFVHQALRVLANGTLSTNLYNITVTWDSAYIIIAISLPDQFSFPSVRIENQIENGTRAVETDGV